MNTPETAAPAAARVEATTATNASPLSSKSMAPSDVSATANSRRKRALQGR